MIQWLVIILGFAALANAQVKNQIQNKIVIGINDFRLVDANMVNLPFKYREVAEAVGLMSMGCTGTHIGNNLVVSAGHCFDAGKVARYKSACDDIQISWGVRGSKPASFVSNCKQVLVIENNNRKDYALFRVDRAPRAAVKIKIQGRPALGTRVTILSHPFRQPLTWSGICEISRSQTDGLNQANIHHKCDTNPGSSGAAIVDAVTLEMVGIHGGGVSEGNRSGSNYGTYIDFTYIPAVLQRLGYR